MRILFDQGVPLPLHSFLVAHEVATAFAMGWAELKNGDLLQASEEKFDLVITTDKNWKYQQRVTRRRIAILILPCANWPELREQAGRVANAVNAAKPGEYLEL
jgi:hypothetical protein